MTAAILLSVFPFFTAFSFSRSVVQGHPHPQQKCASSNRQITPPAGPKLNQKGIKFITLRFELKIEGIEANMGT